MLQIRKGFATPEKDIKHKTWQVAVPEDRKRNFSAKYVEARGIRLRGCARATNTGLHCTLHTVSCHPDFPGPRPTDNPIYGTALYSLRSACARGVCGRCRVGRRNSHPRAGTPNKCFEDSRASCCAPHCTYEYRGRAPGRERTRNS
jgi:hypothetical protein